jgi:hypothetical protein
LFISAISASKLARRASMSVIAFEPSWQHRQQQVERRAGLFVDPVVQRHGQPSTAS